MIISASRRTDIPAFYSKWFMNRIRAGFCSVPNPFNLNQISFVSLKPEDVEVIVFWTRNPRPLMPYLNELDRMGYRYYFQFTLMANPSHIDPKTPPFEKAVKTFRDLAKQIGPEKIIWRYDPIFFTTITGTKFHHENYKKISRHIKGHAFRSVVSIVDIYRKASKRIRKLKDRGVETIEPNGKDFADFMQAMAESAIKSDLEIVSCAEEFDLTVYGIKPGKCVDDEYVRKIFGIDVTAKKDPSQRRKCGCVVSKDIGMYDSCLSGCCYCYATTSFDRARINYRNHDPESPSLIGKYDAESKSGKKAANA